MKTIEVVLPESLLAEVDEIVQELGMTRSEFAGEALKQALKRRMHDAKVAEMEKRQIVGYKRFPVQPGEFDYFNEDS